MSRRFLSVLTVVIAFTAIQALDAGHTLNGENGTGEVREGDAAWKMADDDSSHDPAPQSLIPIQNVSLQVNIPPGKAFYVYFDQATRTLKARSQPDETAGLPPEAIAAIERVPNWIKTDFIEMMARLSELVIDPSSSDDFTSPAMSDMNADGAVDMVLGESSGTLTLYKNVDPALHYTEGYDTYIAAVFVKDISFFPPSVSPVGGYSQPAVGDLDGDNLPDLIIGGGDGRVYYFRNAGPAQSPTWIAEGVIGPVNTAADAAPALADLDSDGDLDLMVGSGGGLLYQCINQGANPQAVSDGNPGTTTNPVWLSQTTVDLTITSNSRPAFGDVDGDGVKEMVVGEGGGHVILYRYSSGDWLEVPGVTSGIYVGFRAAPALVDLDDDTLPDLVVGSKTGPIGFYANVGSSLAPKFMHWQNYATNFDFHNYNEYYQNSNNVYLVYRNTTTRLLQYANIINNAPQKMVDEIAFSIAKASAASLLNPATYPEVYFNNTDSLYFNSQFTRYAQIMDYYVGSPNQWSTVRYLVNESGTSSWYEYPRDVYYWWLVSPKGSDELATFIDPTVMAAGHEGAQNQSNGGMFWRYAAFNTASPTYPPDPSPLIGYPKEESPPVLRDKIRNTSVLWNNTRYKAGRLYNDTGWFYRDAGGNITRLWNNTDQAVEIVLHWVSATVPLDAQRGNDNNRPRQPARIQWEHNGNCGELSDAMWAGLRSALIPARGVCGFGGDHCWAEFYDRGWRHVDSDWDAYGNTINDSDSVHYGANKDWSGIMAVRGDGLGTDTIENYHKTWDASNDTAYPPENEGLIDRANVTVYVTDSSGNPVDGVKVAIGDYHYEYYDEFWASYGTQWTFTNADGKAFFTTSEARQDWNPAEPVDVNDDGLAIYVVSKLGAEVLGGAYQDRLKPSYGDSYNPRNTPMHYYNFTVVGTHPRPSLPVTYVPLPSSGVYSMSINFSAVGAYQRPAVAALWNEGLAYHHYEVNTGHRVTSFFAGEQEFGKFIEWRRFAASNVSYNTTGENLTIGIPSGQDWYYVVSNPGTLETVQVVNFTATLFVPQPQSIDIVITPAMVGRRLMSIPIMPVDTSIGVVVSSISHCIDYTRWYDSLEIGDRWKSYSPSRQHNSLLNLDEKMGFWINFTQPCTWTIRGYHAKSTAIALQTGWNLVGYPSNVTGYTVAQMMADVGLTGMRVESFDAESPPYNLCTLAGTYRLKATEGYWVYVPSDATWIVDA